MPTVGSSLTGKLIPLASTTPTITNLSLVSANTEYSHAFGANTKYWIIQNRDNGKVKVAFTATQSGTNFWTVYAGQQMDSPNLNVTGLTLYAQSPKTNQTLEILEWA